MRGYPLAISLSLFLWALVALLLPSLAGFVEAHPLMVLLTFAACCAAAGRWWKTFRHDVEDE